MKGPRQHWFHLERSIPRPSKVEKHGLSRAFEKFCNEL